MPALLNSSTVMMCPHGGQVNVITSNARSSGGGAFLLRKSDTFLVSGCPLNVSGAPHPCMTVEWVVTAQRSSSSGDVHLNDASVGLCKAGDQAPQGPVSIVSTQQKVSGI